MSPDRLTHELYDPLCSEPSPCALWPLTASVPAYPCRSVASLFISFDFDDFVSVTFPSSPLHFFYGKPVMRLISP